MSDDQKEIVVDKHSTDTNWEDYRKTLESSKSKTRQGKESDGPRYAVYDFNFELKEGEGTRSKIIFVFWCPDTAAVQVSTFIIFTLTNSPK